MHLCLYISKALYKMNLKEIEILDQKAPNQKNIGLNPLLKLKPTKCDFQELESKIKK